MESENDKLVQELLEVVQKKKAEISKAEKPNWLTNCAFRYSKDTPITTNIQVCSDVEELINILGFLIEKETNFNKAQEILGTSYTFNWFGYTIDEWTNDIRTRIHKIQINVKKKELEQLESRLEKLISSKLKTQMELADIKKSLS
jgi:hypothetical protein